MKKTSSWFRTFLLIGLLLVAGGYTVLLWVVPHYVTRALEQALGGEVVVGGARLSFPLTTTLTDVRLARNTAESTLSIQRVVIRPQGISLSTRTLLVDALEIEQPFIRLTRRTSGAWVHPMVPQPVAIKAKLPAWALHIDSIKVVDGVIELVDEQLATPFHGVLDHASFVIGPVTVPAAQEGMSFAVRARIVGSAGHTAPLYCSGWLDLTVKDLQASCRLEPLALAAFDPYYEGRTQFRVYTTELQSTSQWWARSNQFGARVQLELVNAGEGDLSIRGRTIVDFKKLTAGAEHRLSGEVSLSGLLDDPRDWHAEFLPGDDQVQQLVTRLLEHRVQIIKIPVPGGPLRVSIAPAGQLTITDVESASREVEEALEILALPPIPAEPAIPQPALSVEAPVEPLAPAAPSEGSAPTPPAATPEPGATVSAPSPVIEPPPQVAVPSSAAAASPPGNAAAPSTPASVP